MTENLVCFPNNFFTFQSEICVIWKKKKKIPLTKLRIGYSEVISGLYKIQAHEGDLSIDYPIYSA